MDGRIEVPSGTWELSVATLEGPWAGERERRKREQFQRINLKSVFNDAFALPSAGAQARCVTGPLQVCVLPVHCSGSCV